MEGADDRIRAAGEGVLAGLRDAAGDLDDGDRRSAARELGRHLAEGATDAFAVEALVTAGSMLLADLACARRDAPPRPVDSAPLFTYEDESRITRVLY